MEMKGLHKVIYPFAPDQSGAVSVLYELGGLLVIVDAGGCTGNICGFDEPRWMQQKSAVFSAGLRDMDAILGRDELLVRKMAEAAQKMECRFAALIGTPVPATIGTDYKAVARMAEKAIGLPVLALDTNGIRWYDEGAEKAYLALFDRFAAQDGEKVPRSLGILGATPLDLGSLDAPHRLREKLQQQGWERILCYGNGSTLCQIKAAGRTEHNLVISPSGLAAAQMLQKKFGTPYSCDYPNLSPCWNTIAEDLVGKRTLIVHQQIEANALREKILQCGRAEVTVATYFMLKPELSEPQDLHLREEDEFTDLVRHGGYDCILADPAFRAAVPDYSGRFYALPHFAVSGVLQGEAGAKMEGSIL
jgi:hypothetical protein